jgi:hypothetical protein
MVHRRFWTMYHTEPPMDKTVHKWHIKFQQSGCLCATELTSQLGPSAETVDCVRETCVRCSICHQGWTYWAPVRYYCNLKGLSPCWHVPLWHDHPGYSTGRKSWRYLWITFHKALARTQSKYSILRSEFLTALVVRFKVFWGVIVYCSWCFKGLWGLCNTAIHSTDTASYPRWRISSQCLLY